MTRIIHLSDLHFGLHREEVVAPLLDVVNRLGAELVVVTGDLTHRARPAQFQDAVSFLDAIEAPVMVVPGNHDIPLYNLPARIFWPYSGYQKAVGGDLVPAQSIGDLQLWGLNTVNRYSWRGGLVRPDDIAQLTRQLDPQITNIVALHHPLQQVPHAGKELARGAPEALARLAEAGTDIILSGHLHEWAVDELLAQGTKHILQIQSGAALCGRNSERHNEFALLDITKGEVLIERYIHPVDGLEFALSEESRFSRNSGLWGKA